ncbi:hypothetical protein OF83DRAFT_1088529 [Amylostereum chailletii]|nr:hypothetical protein OF83DRAFT_1088529 [Amylostereum chailletii]
MDAMFAPRVGGTDDRMFKGVAVAPLVNPTGRDARRTRRSSQVPEALQGFSTEGRRGGQKRSSSFLYSQTPTLVDLHFSSSDPCRTHGRDAHDGQLPSFALLPPPDQPLQRRATVTAAARRPRTSDENFGSMPSFIPSRPAPLPPSSLPVPWAQTSTAASVARWVQEQQQQKDSRLPPPPPSPITLDVADGHGKKGWVGKAKGFGKKILQVGKDV